ncbi:hypothetical protein T4D_5995 [Trichinella pseudospiralis]|uniref:Uncharacterized protein n=1 Tax=Trichinella pseudospiralis TaxID=6337 RepID=A0A0V1FT18_TRIPS|nr:hypothetical protein T4D_5995 [Trichinella pseudospiralis]
MFSQFLAKQPSLYITKFRKFREKPFSPKITGIYLFRLKIISELQQTYPYRPGQPISSDIRKQVRSNIGF